MNTYNVSWNGLDRGHEGAWSPDLWRDVLNAFAVNSPVNLDDTEGAFFQDLAAKHPEVQWVTVLPTGEKRTYFRDGREPWVTTGVVAFPKRSGNATITSLGKEVVGGEVSYADVLSTAALGYQEKGERPFAILLGALRGAPNGRGLALEDLAKIMRHYRTGDNLVEVLEGPAVDLTATASRRLKGILLLMTYSGLAIKKDNEYYAGQDASTLRKATGEELKTLFVQWLRNNLAGSGKAESYVTALDDADVIAQAFCSKFKVPSVYDMPDTSLMSLSAFISEEKKKEDATSGSSQLYSLAGLHGRSYWCDGYCMAAISALIEFKRNLRKANNDESQSCVANDILTVALKLFKENRVAFAEGEKVNDGIRAYFDPLTPEKLRAFTQAQFEDLFLGKGQYEHMWAGTNGMGWGHIKEAGCKASMEFIAKIRESPIPIDTFCDKKFDAPGGFGQVVIAELHLKFYPKEYCAYSKRTGIALEALKLKTNTYSGSFTAEDYLEVKEATEKIRKRMVDLGISRTRNDGEEADYLTANEFIDWVCNNKDLVKEKVMSSKMKKDKPTKLEDEKRVELKFDPNKKDDELLLRLLASLRAKPFAILAGHSGTGKSRYVKKLAYMTCNANELRVDGALPGNYLLLQVKPNWHDSTELLGFRNAMVRGQYQKTALIEFVFRAYHFKDTPFFLCLDEMNLAPVEQYFAEFLSAMESREPVPLNDITEKDENLFDLGCEWEDALDALKEHKFSIPKNLFIVGTVNMDETTNQFSRKVLDRAFTIEMTDVDFMKFDGSNCPEPSYDDTIEEGKIQELLKGEFCATKLDDDDRTEGASLIKVQKALEPTPFAIAYRFASEYTLLKRALEVFDPGKTMKLDALDQAVLMKVLPRVAGEAEYIAKVYGKDESEGLRHALEGKTVSLKKIKEILDRAELTGAQYITFWP